MAGRLLSEAEQAARYSEVVKVMAGRPVCIRLLDLGNDKTAQWMGTSAQGGPAAGQRGAGFLLARPEFLRAGSGARPCHCSWPDSGAVSHDQPFGAVS